MNPVSSDRIFCNLFINNKYTDRKSYPRGEVFCIILLLKRTIMISGEKWQN